MKRATPRGLPAARAVVLVALGLALVSCSKETSGPTAPATPRPAQNWGSLSINPASTPLTASGAEYISDLVSLHVTGGLTYHEICFGSRSVFCYSGLLDLPPECDASYWTLSGTSLGSSQDLTVIVDGTDGYVMAGDPLTCRIRVPAAVLQAASAQGQKSLYADITLRAYPLEHCLTLGSWDSARGNTHEGDTKKFRLTLTF